MKEQNKGHKAHRVLEIAYVWLSRGVGLAIKLAVFIHLLTQ